MTVYTKSRTPSHEQQLPTSQNFCRHLTRQPRPTHPKKFSRIPAAPDDSTPRPAARPAKKCPNSDPAPCRMGVVIAPSNRIELGAFLAQPGATCLRIPLQRVPVNSTGRPSMENATVRPQSSRSPSRILSISKSTFYSCGKSDIFSHSHMCIKHYDAREEILSAHQHVLAYFE